MTVETKRFIKRTAKTSFWVAGDIFFLALKAMGTALLVALTTGAVFACIFLIYLRTNLSTGLEVNPDDFVLSLSSVICYIDPETGKEVEMVTLQSTEFRRLVDYDDIPEHMINAVVAIEDHRYFEHHGVDWYRTAGAFMNMFLSMRDTFGGSTITQQLIKNLTHEDDVTVQRKLQEIFRALEFERQFNKEEILERYLNLVYFGHGCYGLGAASNYYFGKEVSELTLAESAAIIGITNNPSMYSPYANSEANKKRQEVILGRMSELGYIESGQELRKAINAPLNFKRGDDYVYEQEIYTWFEEAVIWEVIADLQREKGYSEQWAKRRLYTGGLRIIATIDMEMQAIVDEIYQNPDSLPRVTGSSQPLQSGIVVADPYTGEILALSGGVGSKTRNMLLSRATMTRRPPGSSLKPISCYAPAMEYGLLTPDTLYEDSEYITLSGTTWMPRNADRGYSGIVDVRQAIRVSLNTIPAVVLDQLGPSVSFRFMRDALGFGLHPADEDYAPLAAGQLTHGATVREMASGFSMFPNGGERSELRTYSRVYDADGNIYLDN
ncbi:MAG: transglycosylase domain-containing protein, partial [Synergistaceae bacterium]|nr:transglycosylase domain-containing protein [Synergistaceae bacterium]